MTVLKSVLCHLVSGFQRRQLACEGPADGIKPPDPDPEPPVRSHRRVEIHPECALRFLPKISLTSKHLNALRDTEVSGGPNTPLRILGGA